LKDDISKKSQRDRVLPLNWCLLNHTAVGVYRLGSDPEEQNMALFDFHLGVQVFEDVWTAIPIIDAQTIIASDWSVLREASDEVSGWQRAHLGRDILFTQQRRESEDGPVNEHLLLTNQSGSYRILFSAYVRVPKRDSLHTMSLNLAHPISATSFQLEHVPGTTRSVIKELSVEPASYHEIVEGNASSQVSVKLPYTKTVEFKWRMTSSAKASWQSAVQSEKQEAENATTDDEETEQAPLATVVHSAFYSIAESVLHSESTFKFVLDTQQSLSNVELVVLGGARVTSVSAFGMKSWRAMHVSNYTFPGDVAAGKPRSGTAVQVSFKSSVISKEVLVVLNMELDFNASSGRLVLPQVVCKNVLRQTGTIAVVKEASVEVHEHEAIGVVRAGVGEIPSHVRSRTDRPIVVAYKFLSPQHTVSLSILQHQEVETLTSVVDATLYEVLVTDTQHMHLLTMALQNSQRQYMAVHDIPASATLWSLRVNRLATTPVRGRDGTLMVPLLVGTSGESNDGGSAMKASVELSWMTEHAPLGENGTVVLSPPRVDMPVSALSVEVQLPEQYIANFTGTLQNVSIFSQRQPRAVNYQTDSHVVETDYRFSVAPAQSDKSTVKVKIPRQGKRYRFEKILVVGGNAALSVNYTMDRSCATCDAGLWGTVARALRYVNLKVEGAWARRGKAAPL
jgi:hypothetical protein